MRESVTMLITAAISTLGFSILFYVHPRRLFVATLGGVLTTAVYLLAGHFLGGELLPNLIGALVGAGFSEIMARFTKVPVPVYMVPCVIPLVPGSALYETMFNFVTGSYTAAAAAGMRALEIAMGIAGGIVVASVIGLFIRPPKKKVRQKKF
ncbi:MAG: threonine/serine exporter family protein [Clostridia bacterium]|nr:threonine/serine exporter family protein [Clostridia bacterium]